MKVWEVSIFYRGQRQDSHIFETFDEAHKFFNSKLGAIRHGLGPMWVVGFPVELQREDVEPVRDPDQCECQDCGKKFRRGDEGDNERFCLRCEHESRINRMDPDERDQYEVFGDMDGRP